MILLGIDLETTGLDAKESEITEIGWAIFDTTMGKKPLTVQSHLIETVNPVPELITELTGITDALLEKAGEELKPTLTMLLNHCSFFKVDALVAHNAPFDRGFLEEKIKACGLSIPDWHWIDTRTDIDFPQTMKQRSLITLAAEHGFLNPFPHSAIFDVFTMMRILSHYDAELVFSNSKKKWILVQALVSFADKDLAKEKGFAWEKWNGKTYTKSWVKAYREDHLDEARTACSFPIKILGAP